jgi:hypothetical protein
VWTKPSHRLGAGCLDLLLKQAFKGLVFEDVVGQTPPFLS